MVGNGCASAGRRLLIWFLVLAGHSHTDAGANGDANSQASGKIVNGNAECDAYRHPECDPQGQFVVVHSQSIRVAAALALTICYLCTKITE